MDVLLENKFLFWMFLLVCRVVYAMAIYYKIDCESKATRNMLAFLSFPFPMITGIICTVKYRKSVKDAVIILIVFVFSLASTMLVSAVYSYSQAEKYYEKDGTEHLNLYDMRFTDVKGNSYAFDYDKSGYDRLYINNTDEYLNANLCYVNSEGYLSYDEDMSITAKDETVCTDTDGAIYYPAKYTVFNEDQTIRYDFNSANFDYDRFGNAYTYDYVPYFNEEGNKYAYTFDSSAQQGYYTNLSTKETFDNEYSFVDENGYFVYDKEHEFVKQETEEDIYQYKDSTGKVYYWASSVSWDKDGNMLNCNDEIIDFN